MGKICCLLFSLISLSILVGSHASVSPEDYWKLMLPNTPMPQSIQDSLLVGPPDGPPATAESSSKSTDGPGVAIVANTKGSLRTLSGYIGLLSYSQKNEGSLKTLSGYIGLLSYSQKKKPLASENGYLSYSNQEKSATTTNGGYLSYNQEKSVTTTNGVYLSYSQEKSATTTNGGYLSYANQKEKSSYLSYIKPESKSTKVSPSHVEDSAIKNGQFFMEKDLQIGTKKNLEFKKGTKKGVFLPRDVSNTIPFSSDKVQETLRLLSLDPKSEKAYILSQRIKLCEEPTIQGVEKQCVTSLESMVDYVTSKLGTNVKAMYTKVEKDANGEYTITGVKRLTKEDRETVVCHKMDYPYAVYFCHRTDTIRSYTVSLVGEDGAKMEAVGACHKEINAMLEDYEINVLKVEPRSARICHFPSSDNIIWARN